MTPLGRIALIGNSLPRRCGIATFTTDLQRAISSSRPNLMASIVAMTDHGQTYDYPGSVALQIKDDSHRSLCARRSVSERRPIRHRLSAARIRNLRRRSRRPHPRAAVAPHHAGGDDAAHGAGQADGGATRGDGSHRRRCPRRYRDGQQGTRAASKRLSRAGRKNRGHRPWHSRLSVCRA